MGSSRTIISKSNHLGISISSNSVCAIGLDDHQNIIYSDSFSSEIPYFINDEVNNEALTNTLKILVEKSGNVSNKAAVCFPERIAYSREHILPKLKISEIDEALQWQIGSIFPLQAEDIYIDWKLLSQTATETKIVVVAVNRKFLDALQTACVDAGLRPMSFEPSASALARAQKDQTIGHVILEVDRYGSSASLIENGVSSLTTTSVYSSTQTLDQILAQINTSLQNLIFHRTESLPIVFLTGEKATPKLAELLSSSSHLPVSMLSLPTANPSLHVSFLAALSALLPPESELSINLLPVSLQQQYQLETNIEAAKKTTTIGSVLGSLSLLVAICFCIVSIVFNKSLTKEMASAKDLKNNEAPVNIALALKKAQLINQINPQKQVIPTIQILALQEAGVKTEQIRKLTFDSTRKQIQLTLASVGRENIYSIKNNLEKTTLFSSISVPLSTFSTDSNPETTITLIIK